MCKVSKRNFLLSRKIFGDLSETDRKQREVTKVSPGVSHLVSFDSAALSLC